MRCLFCDKEIKEGASEIEQKTAWHKKCVKAFFGTDAIPEIDISEEMLKKIAEESTKNGFTVPGVQKKLSLHLSNDDGKPRLTLVNYPTGYILKPQTEQFDSLPESEYLVMSMAKATGIKVVPFALLKINGKYAYITRRVDRITVDGETKKLAMEDFCQLDGRLTEDKYKGSYEKCGKIISEHSSRKVFDLSEFFMRIVFCFVVGNSDMHLKNFSLIETSENSKQYVLSEAYDLLPVNVILPEDKNQFGLALNGKLTKARRKDFIALAGNIGIAEITAKKIIDSVISKKELYLTMCDNSYLSADFKYKLKSMICSRIEVFC